MSDELEPIDDQLNNNFEEDDFDDDDFDDDEYYDDDDDIYGLGNFGKEVEKTLGTNVKQFLAEYYGEEVMANLESETYLEIENIIKEAFYYGFNDVPDVLYLNRSIPHEDFDAAMDAYVYTPKSFDWPKRTDEWFERDFGNDEEDDIETYLKESDPIDLTEQEIAVKNALDAADNFIDGHAAFADFTKRGYQKLSVDIQNYLNERIAFDLEMVTEEGFKQLEETIYWLITEMLNELFGAVNHDLKNKQE